MMVFADPDNPTVAEIKALSDGTIRRELKWQLDAAVALLRKAHDSGIRQPGHLLGIVVSVDPGEWGEDVTASGCALIRKTLERRREIREKEAAKAAARKKDREQQG